MLYHLEKSYHEDPILNPLTPWERPPLKNVFCIYGVDSKTEGNRCRAFQNRGIFAVFGSIISLWWNCISVRQLLWLWYAVSNSSRNLFLEFFRTVNSCKSCIL